MRVGPYTIYFITNYFFMAIKVRRVKRVFGFEEEKTEKYLIIPDRATVVSFEHLCDQIADTVGLHRGVVRAAIYGLVSSMKTFIRQGHAVRIDGFGTFIPTISAKSSAIEEEADVDSIRKVSLRFTPCMELKELLKGIEFEFDVTDSTNDTKEAEEGGSESDDEETGIPNP